MYYCDILYVVLLFIFVFHEYCILEMTKLTLQAVIIPFNFK